MSEALLRDAVKLHRAGELARAAELYGAILKTAPRHFEALYFLGFLNFQCGRFVEAERLMADALLANPRSADAHYNRGCALVQLQRHGDALVAFDRALACKPDYADAAVNRGTVLMALFRPSEALVAFDHALRLRPADKEALSNRGTVLFELKRYREAAETYQRLLALDPDFPFALGSLALARAYACDWSKRSHEHAALHSAIRAGKPALAPHAATLLSPDAQDQLICAHIWVEKRAPAQAPLWRGERYRHDKVRVAYLSADFHDHSTAHLAVGLFEQHDRSRFETVALSFGPDDGSAMRARLTKAFDRFADVRGIDDASAAKLLREMEIDIAVDLKGFTQHARPGILSFRAAPVQVNYLGHPGTMGAPYIDYILADRVLIPPEARAHYSESVALLPGSYQCNDAMRGLAPAPSRAEAGLPATGFVFACFNPLYKIVPDMFGVWLRLLTGVPDSVLWLFQDNGDAPENLKREAGACGIDPERLIFAPRLPQAQHLSRQALADLFLDTLPCNAHTTASDALWAGLPVLTCLGTTFAGRVAASLLMAVGLPELVTQSLAEYEVQALKLAGEPQALAALRERLAQNRLSSALFDTRRSARDIEAAYLQMTERAARSLPPTDFAVPDLR